ncbi:MAG: threonine synthase [Oscillospiraceae bacterium]|jgi:threonine synthase
MKYYSTRNEKTRVTASQAIAGGLAPDGGLYVPECIPAVTLEEIKALCKLDYRQRAKTILSLYLEEFSNAELEQFVEAAYADNYDTAEIAPVHFLDEKTGVLELWHGPTCAFKDMALQMLPHLLTASLKKTGESRKVCILVATSGDTGKAALEGFKDVDGTCIQVFFPVDGVSDVQKLQMTTQAGNNVLVSAVYGNFDDAQTGVKTIFGDRDFAKQLSDRGFFLSSANSINWGRLLPQIVYYFSAYCEFVNAGHIALGDTINVCVPTGNFGNILAGWYAKKMGLPVQRFICASNSNNVLTEFIETGVYDKNRAFYTTTSPSMDILVSSNLERLLYALSGDDSEVAAYMEQLSTTGVYTVSEQVRAAVANDFAAGCCDDAATKAQIAKVYQEQHYLMDTHTAVGSKVLEDYRAKTGDLTPAVLASTASPFKFCDSVLEALGQKEDAPGTALLEKLSAVTGLPVPAPLSGLGQREVRFRDCCAKDEMKASVDAFLS